MSDETNTDKYDILHGDDCPGLWSVGSVGGKWITFRLPKGVDVGCFDVSDNECVELVLDIGGDHKDSPSERPIDIWVVCYRPERIVMNYRDIATEINSTVGLESASKLAVEWMIDNSGEQNCVTE